MIKYSNLIGFVSVIFLHRLLGANKLIGLRHAKTCLKNIRSAEFLVALLSDTVELVEIRNWEDFRVTNHQIVYFHTARLN